ncbi:hypothetical protein JXB12_08450 [candidate division KSB1 bacterium]|nr:hypothetical protein [candidate division KSB1 bacterium]
MIIPERVKRVQAQQKEFILKKKNVRGMGFGYKYTAGERTEHECLVIFVEKKVALRELDPKDVIPGKLGGVRTDVKEVGKIVANQARTDKWRPVPPGVSIGHHAISAGTLGAVVKDKTTKEIRLLSNNHVFADSNKGQLGDSILQPGPFDNGVNPDDVVAVLDRFIPLEYLSEMNGEDETCSMTQDIASFMNWLAKLFGAKHRFYTKRISKGINLVDAAIARPLQPEQIVNEIIDIGVVSEIKNAELGMKVRKSGRTTGTTFGYIEALDATIQVNYDLNRVAQFEHQILTTSMSQGGDSGSLLVDAEENKAVGLLFAGSELVTIHSPISTVFELLDISF